MYLGFLICKIGQCVSIHVRALSRAQHYVLATSICYACLLWLLGSCVFAPGLFGIVSCGGTSSFSLHAVVVLTVVCSYPIIPHHPWNVEEIVRVYAGGGRTSSHLTPTA